MQSEKAETSLEIESQGKNVRDRYKVVYILFALVGIIHMLPATFFVNANDYWMYKFRNTSSEEVDSNHRTYFQVEFSPSITISSHVASVVFSFYLIFFGHKLPLLLRLYGALISVLVMYIISAIFINVDTDSWQTGYFVFTMLIVAGINGMGAIFGLTAFTIIAKFPEESLGSYINGQGVAAMVSAFLQLLALAVGISTTKSAMVYFWIAIGMIIVSLVYMVLVFKHNQYFRFYDSKEVEKVTAKRDMNFKEFFSIVLTLWKSLLVIALNLLASNALHPTITSLVVSEGEGNSDWNDVYFVPVVTYVFSAVSEYLGRITTIKFSHILMKIDGIWYVIFCAARLVIFTPLIMLCNAQPRSHMSVIFPHDYQFIIIVLVFGFTNGFTLSASNFLIPATLPPERLEDGYHVFIMWASILSGAFAVLGFVTVDLL